MKEGHMKLNIKMKLIGGFLIVAALLIGVFGIGFSALNSVNNESSKIYQNSNENYLWQQWKAFQERESTYYLAYLSNQNVKYLDSAQEQASYAQKVQEELIKVVPATRKQQYDTIVSQTAVASKLGKASAEALASKNMQALTDDMTAWENNDNQIVADIDAAIASSKQDTNESMAASNTAKNNATVLMIIIAVSAVLIAIGLGVFLSQSISGAIKKINHALRKMAASDLTERVNIHSSDETGEMAKSYNVLLEERIRVVKRLRDSASQIMIAGEQMATVASQSGEATQQVAASSQQMAKGAQEQSTSVQETAQSVRQLSEVINQLAKGAIEQSSGVQKAVASITDVSDAISQAEVHVNQATKGAKEAAASATAGAEKSKLALIGMDKIKNNALEVSKKIEELGARSVEIGKIVSVIDDIAAQTNLLALNAAIEAARAGEQGRGFAVVSDEVRKLAERTATATKEIADLINNVQKGVKETHQVMAEGAAAVSDGYNLSVQAGQALDQILKTSSEVNSQVEQVSVKAQLVNTSATNLVKVIDSVGSITEENTAATEQMSANATQVSKAMETVAGISEENSAATEEVSASAQELNAQIEEISASAQSLKELAVELEKSMANYKLMPDSESVAR
jgi:methyl-accepting chemotaxis protein